MREIEKLQTMTFWEMILLLLKLKSDFKNIQNGSSYERLLRAPL